MEQRQTPSEDNNYCDRCNQVFPSRAMLRQHVIWSRSHFLCWRCLERGLTVDCWSPDAYDRHLSDAHNFCFSCNEPMPWGDEHNCCFNCNASFPNEFALKRHKVDFHHKCFDCGECHESTELLKNVCYLDEYIFIETNC